MSQENRRKLAKKAAVEGIINNLLEETKVTKGDTGKIFYIGPGNEKGKIMDVEEFGKMNHEKVNQWTLICAADINSQ